MHRKNVDSFEIKILERARKIFVIVRKMGKKEYIRKSYVSNVSKEYGFV